MQFAGVGGRFDDAADCIALGDSAIAAVSDSPPPFTMAQSRFGIGELRDYLAGGSSGELPVDVCAKVTSGIA